MSAILTTALCPANLLGIWALSPDVLPGLRTLFPLESDVSSGLLKSTIPAMVDLRVDR